MQNLTTLLQKIQDVKVIDSQINYSEYVALDLSISNNNLDTLDLTDPNLFEQFIEDYLRENNSKVAFGGYLEKRNLYKRSTVFNNTSKEERNIHLGLDLWIKAGTPVLAAFDGIVHSFQNNKSLGDYGPTIILEHEIDTIKFYTLYGHLSEESLTNLYAGKPFSKGAQLAVLGDASVNGLYAPHLHFQIIKSIDDKKGDYPGVCAESEIDFYRENCPDPNILLKI